MKKKAFYGTSTALITPFRDGKIDYAALEKIIEAQLSGGIKSLVVGGTTAEAATLGGEERRELYEFARAKTRGRAALILGTGTNDTAEAVRRTKEAAEIGCDAALVVTPYYNKGTVVGVTEHYQRIANCSDLPIIVYNVPGRTGVNLTFSQLEQFSKSDKIIGIKEATDSIDRFVKIAALGEDLPLYSGNDSEAYITMALGGFGIISVVSNLYPQGMLRITDSFLAGDFAASLKAQRDIAKLADALFLETNPAPIKYAMKLRGLCTEQLRLPLSPPSAHTKRVIKKVMEQIPDFTN